MTSGPLPPHERPWRHPSELAGPAPEPTTRNGRLLILSTATISLLLVGVLALALAPRRAGRSEDAFVASTLIVVTAPLAAGVVTAESAAPTTTIPPPTAAPAATAAPSGGPATTAVSRGFRPGVGGYGSGAAESGWPGTVVVTPLGGALAVTTASALERGRTFDAVVPSGEDVSAQMIASSAGLAFVMIVDGSPVPTMAVAAAAADDAMYLSLGDTTIPIEPGTLTTADVPEGTPLVNSNGDLVGLCTHGDDGIEVVPIGTVPGVGG